MHRLFTASVFALIAAGAAATAQANPLVTGANEFCMYDPTGALVGGACDGQVTGALDPVPASGAGNALSSPAPFFGFNWTAHDIVTYAPGSYSVDTGNGIYNFTVNPGQIGVSMLFDWNVTTDIDVVNVWDASFDGSNLTLISTDWDNDGVPGGKMIDGPFPDFSANFNLLVQGDIRPAPVAVDDNAGGITNGQTKNVNLINNDVYYGPVSVTVCGTSANCSAPDLATTSGGTLIDNGDGSVDYTAPAAPFSGSDTFYYQITDDTGQTSAAATVTATVSSTANTPPTANNVQFSTDEDTPLVINVTDTDDVGTAIGVDGDGDVLTFTASTPISPPGQPANGNVTLDATRTILTYAPQPNFNGTDTFSFRVSDGIDESNSAEMSVVVSAVNDPITCTDVTTSTPSDTTLDIDVQAVLLSTCTDPDTGDTITLASTTQPTQGGTVAFDGAQTLTYTPAPGFEGQDTFTYTATDGTATDTRTVTVNVTSGSFGNFTMLDAAATTFGGTNDIVYEWDGSLNTSADSTNFNMTMGSASNFKFFGFPWSAHNIRVFGPGTYEFDTTCSVAELESGVANCGGTADQILTLTVAAGQIGAHILFDWNVTSNIDVVIVWEQNGSFDNPPPGALYQGPEGPTPAKDSSFAYVSRDADGDGVPGARMIDGPFIDFQANFNLENLSGGGEVEVPVSTIDSPSLGGGCSIRAGEVGGVTRIRVDWLLMVGFIGMVALSRQRRLRRTRP